MYALLIKRFKEATISEDMRTGNIRVVDIAEWPLDPVKPNKRMYLMLAIVAGLVIGISLAFFFEHLDNTIKVPEDLKQHLQVPYLGPTPLVVKANGNSQNGTRWPELVCLHAPKSSASEAYRGLRTNILFSSAGAPPQVILLTSPVPKEGKTITTANLAIAMAQSGNRVAILDCDLRRPKIHKLFDVTRSRGITNLLVGENGMDKNIFHSQIPNLDLILSGPLPPDPSEMLASSRMQDLLTELKKRYNRILIDSPPITAVTDAVILSKYVDGVVLVIRAGDTVRDVAKNSLDQLHAVGANILGCVLNAVDIGKDKYYYYYYYQYYNYYYGDDGDKKRDPQKKRRKKQTKGGNHRPPPGKEDSHHKSLNA